MNKEIGICIPYFGKLPSNMTTFLLSCSKNKDITFFIFTDDPIYKKFKYLYKNVIFIESNLLKIKKRILEITGISSINLEQPYKLCDYRPLYGVIFAKYLQGFDYWGYSDLDMVYGQIMKYIRYGINHKFEKIGRAGHFTLYRNDKRNNNRYKLPIIRNGKKVYLFRDIVSQTSKSCSFDEDEGIDIIYNQYKIPTYCNPYLVNDIIFPNLDLNTNDRDKYRTKHQCYIWNNGRAEFYYTVGHKIKEHDYGYFHFQKRRCFKDYIYDKNISLFSITTYGYNKLNQLTLPNIKHSMRKNKSLFIKRLIYKFKSYCFTDNFVHRAHIGKLRLPIKYILKSVFINKNFEIFKI